MHDSVDLFRSAYRYLQWANDRVLEAASALSAEQYTRDLGVSFRSVHGTLAHMVGSEWLWLERWRGNSPSAVPRYNDWQSASDLAGVWRAVASGQTDFLTRLSAADLERKVAYRNFAGEPKEFSLADVLLHALNHATYHRGQVTAMLRQLGAVPPATDYTLYLDTIRSQA